MSRRLLCTGLSAITCTVCSIPIVTDSVHRVNTHFSHNAAGMSYFPAEPMVISAWSNIIQSIGGCLHYYFLIGPSFLSSFTWGSELACIPRTTPRGKNWDKKRDVSDIAALEKYILLE